MHLCDGLKAVAQPLSESAERQMLESNQRVINDVAVSILELVEPRGFEPRSRPYEWKFCKLLTASLSGWPLFTCATITPGLRKMVVKVRFELTPGTV
jgi:hypothetical protein